MTSITSRKIISGMLICVCCAACVRSLKFFHVDLFDLNTSHITFLCYNVMVMLYLYDVTRRLINKHIKIALFMSGLFMMLWLFIRTIKYELDPRDHLIVRNLWYAYYFCDLSIVTSIIQAILLVYNQTSLSKLLVLGGLSFTMSLFVFTNDYHQWVFAFPKGLTHYNHYSYQVGYYIIMIYIALLILISFGIILQKERVHFHKIIYPMAFYP